MSRIDTVWAAHLRPIIEAQGYTFPDNPAIPDDVKDDLFRQYAEGVIELYAPHIPAVLEEWGVRATAGPGWFIVAVPETERREAFIVEAPEVAEKLALLPWPQPGETAH